MKNVELINVNEKKLKNNLDVLLKEISNKKNNKLEDLQKKYSTNDLIIRTEEYSEEYLKEFLNNNKTEFSEIDKMSTKKIIEEFSKIKKNKKNPLLDIAKKNMNEIKLPCLKAILKTKNLKIKPKSHYKKFFPDQFLDMTLLSKTTNMLNPKLFPQFDLNLKNKNKTYFLISFFSSLYSEKINEFYVEKNSLVIDLIDSEKINCIFKKMNTKKYKKIMLIENNLLIDENPQRLENNFNYIFKKLKIKIPELKIKKMQTTKFSELEFKLGKIYILRDNQGCDHFFTIKDIVITTIPNYKDNKIISVFQNRYKRRFCCVCEKTRASFLTKNSQVDVKPFNFFCQECYYDLHFTENNMLKELTHELYNYCYEES